MEIKHIIISLFFISIVYSLGSALYYMMKDQGGSKRMVKALTLRIGVSILLFVFIIISFWMGWIKPTGVA